VSPNVSAGGQFAANYVAPIELDERVFSMN
jgi:hypothetical protein